MKKVLKATLMITTAFAIVTGCTSEPETASTDTQPVASAKAPDNEIFIYTVYPAFYAKEDIWEKQVGQYLKKKFPDLTFKHVQWDNPGRQYKDLIAAGTIPDIIIDNARMNLQRNILKNDLQYDMTELIKKYNFDTSTLNPAAMQQMKNVTPEGKIYGLPFQLSDFVLFYNKDIFDKFGVDYPKDGMTYDEVYELAKKLTRVEGEKTYKGYQQHPGLYMTYNQLSLSPLSLTEDKAELNTPAWKKQVDNLRRFYEIPANQFTSVDDFPKGNMAMSVHVTEKIVQWYEQNKNLNFDIAAMPSFSDAPGVKAQPNLYSAYISKQSTKKDQAFQVIQYLLSEEMQINFAKEGIIGPLQTPKVQEAFGKNLPQMQGKHTEAIFYGKNAMPPAARAAGLTYIDVPVHGVFQPLIFGESKDSVTALRMIEESSTKAIQTEKAAQ
ncbi:ABC transporter substrate-binding protein [Paenibacillus sp. GCM10023248]|uniref:ABC transporter substrate-binding protein n=1 Tax=Bacillales TaxID=1385 RepID=UPI0023798C59|nr:MULTISPECIES: extracellular solute-binding protein [Bacillales]MDD9269161.1 extracellular solute-binding protein [Paenibacillus sp. MAHUQ-63]MDR6880619.1 multiple sugar transport system substrate-binding protein [Bacillus sp. 3255]